MANNSKSNFSASALGDFVYAHRSIFMNALAASAGSLIAAVIFAITLPNLFSLLIGLLAAMGLSSLFKSLGATASAAIFAGIIFIISVLTGLAFKRIGSFFFKKG